MSNRGFGPLMDWAQVGARSNDFDRSLDDL